MSKTNEKSFLRSESETFKRFSSYPIKLKNWKAIPPSLNRKQLKKIIQLTPIKNPIKISHNHPSPTFQLKELEIGIIWVIITPYLRNWFSIVIWRIIYNREKIQYKHGKKYTIKVT